MKYFQIQELVDRNTYMKYGERAWMVFNPKALEALDGLREYFGVPVIVNNWWQNQNTSIMQYRGFRPQDCPVGAEHSEHKLGNAFDCTVGNYSAEHIRKKIIENEDDPLLCRIMRLEANVNWVHFDCKEVKNRIYVFKA